MQWKIRNTIPSLSGPPFIEFSESLPLVPVLGEAYVTNFLLTIKICAYIFSVSQTTLDNTHFILLQLQQ